MSGLDYGWNYRLRAGASKRNKPGVFYIKSIDMWVVRVLNKKNVATTIKKYKRESAANKFYKKQMGITI